MPEYGPGFYWVRYTRGPLKGELNIAERGSLDSWWFIARETSRSDRELKEVGIEVLERVKPPEPTKEGG